MVKIDYILFNLFNFSLNILRLSLLALHVCTPGPTTNGALAAEVAAGMDWFQGMSYLPCMNRTSTNLWSHSMLIILLCPVVWAQEKGVVSSLETFDITTGKRSLVLREEKHFEAPNWSTDGLFFIINQDGSLFKVFHDGRKENVNTGFANRCNNDHGISPDGTKLVISHEIEDGPEGWLTSCIFTLPITRGTPKRITPLTPSFWHGWSPDGKP